MSYLGPVEMVRQAAACPGLQTAHVALVAVLAADADPQGLITTDIPKLVWGAKMGDVVTKREVLWLQGRLWLDCWGTWDALNVKLYGHAICTRACRFVGRAPGNPENGRKTWGAFERIVYDRDLGKCRYCGASEGLVIDHVTPQSKGGQTTLDNVVLACFQCNSSKGSRGLHEARMALLPIGGGL